MMSHDAPNQIALLLALTLGLAPGRASEGPPTRAPAAFEKLKVGQVVSVDGQSAGVRTVVARSITIEKELAAADKLKGRIQAIRPRERSLMLLGVKVGVPGDAPIVDNAGGALSLSELQRGWVLKAKGQLREDGALHATEIKGGNPKAAEIEVQGTVQAVDADRRTLTVVGFSIRVTAHTRITSE